MSTDHLIGVILGAFPVLGLAIAFLARYIIKIHKESGERTERIITATLVSSEANTKMSGAVERLSDEISALKINTLMQTKVLESIERKS